MMSSFPPARAGICPLFAVPGRKKVHQNQLLIIESSPEGRSPFREPVAFWHAFMNFTNPVDRCKCDTSAKDFPEHPGDGAWLMEAK